MSGYIVYQDFNSRPFADDEGKLLLVLIGSLTSILFLGCSFYVDKKYREITKRKVPIFGQSKFYFFFGQLGFYLIIGLSVLPNYVQKSYVKGQYYNTIINQENYPCDDSICTNLIIQSFLQYQGTDYYAKNPNNISCGTNINCFEEYTNNIPGVYFAQWNPAMQRSSINYNVVDVFFAIFFFSVIVIGFFDLFLMITIIKKQRDVLNFDQCAKMSTKEIKFFVDPLYV